MKTLQTVFNLTILLPVAVLLLGLVAIVNPSKARRLLKESIQAANAKTGSKRFVVFARS